MGSCSCRGLVESMTQWRYLILSLVLAATPAGRPTAQERAGIEYAAHARLAAQSLLLDSTRIGDRLVVAGERGHILTSDDEGATWQQADTVPTRATLTTLASAGGRLWAAGHDTVIVTSSDRGRNWTLQHFEPERLQPVMDLHFFDTDHGLAIGAYGLMLETRDGGATWRDRIVNEEDDYHLNALVELADGTLLIAGEAGHSYRSIDRGESWASLDLPYPGSMFTAFEAGDGCVMFAGLRGHAMRSCDAGTSWAEVPTGSETTLMDGTAAGDGVLLVGNAGTILQGAVDSGFRVFEHSSGATFASVLRLADGRYLLTGENGTHFFPEPVTTGGGP